MRILTGTVLLVLALVSTANAQENFVSLELLGRAGLYSTNYERYLTRRFGVGAGIAIWNVNRGQHAIMAPLYVSANPIGDKNSIYVGAGATLVTSNVTLFSSKRSYSSSLLGTASLGYQHRTPGGMVIRPAVHLIFQGDVFVFWPGIAVGYSF